MVKVLSFYIEVEEADEDGVWGYRANIRLGDSVLRYGRILHDRHHAFDDAETFLAAKLIELLD